MSNMLSYKGYHATVAYDAEDEIFVGTVFGVRDTIAFHGTSAQELNETFRDCIDTYLQVCAEQGISPDKEYKGSFNVRLTPELHRKAALAAEQEGISLNQLIQKAIEEHVEPSPYKNIAVLLPTTSVISAVKPSVAADYIERYRGCSTKLPI